MAASLEPLADRRNVAGFSLFYRHYFGRCSSELAQLVPLPFSQGRFTCYSDRLHDFFVTISRCYKDVYVNSSFLGTARLWNSLPRECFPLTYDLRGFKSRINIYLLTLGSFFHECFNLFVLFFSCISMPGSGCSALQDMFKKHRQDCERPRNAQFDIYTITSNFFNKFWCNCAKNLIIM